MNIGIMLKTLNNRIKSDEFKPLTIKNIEFFKIKSDWITDFLLISSMWADIEPTDQLFIVEKLIGIRLSYELLILFKWINENKDVDNFSIISELNTQ